MRRGGMGEHRQPAARGAIEGATGGAIGVVIVSYNTRDLLCDCLQSLQACSLPLHILVVDNGSTDDSVEQVAARFPAVRLVALGQNRGFAAANNVGLRLLLGAAGEQNDNAPLPASEVGKPPPDYFLLLNPDTLVHPGAIEHLVDFLSRHPRVGMASPRLLNPDGSIQAAAFRFPTLTMSLLDVFPPGEMLPGRLYGSWWHGRYPQEWATSPSYPIDHPLGACMLVRRSTIEAVGLLDERYFIYCEEIDWCWRIRQAGWAIWQVPVSRVTHIGGASTGQIHHRMLVELHRSRIRFFRQHYSRLFLRLHRAITLAGMLRLILLAWYRWLVPLHPTGARGAAERGDLRKRVWACSMVMRLLETETE